MFDCELKSLVQRGARFGVALLIASTCAACSDAGSNAPAASDEAIRGAGDSEELDMLGDPIAEDDLSADPDEEAEEVGEPVAAEGEEADDAESTEAPGTAALSATAAMAHPSIFVDREEIRAIKAKIATGDQPWKAAYARLMSDANAALGRKPLAITANGGPEGGHYYFTANPYLWKVNGKWVRRDGQVNPNADRRDYSYAIAVGRSVRSLGLAYALTGDEKYATKALSFIRTWSLAPKTRMTPKMPEGVRPIEVYVTMTGFLYGADLVWNSPAWKGDEKAQFQSWARACAKSANKLAGRKNNIEMWNIAFVAAASVIADDSAGISAAVARWQKNVPTQVRADGALPQELARTGSLGYSVYALNAMTQGAEIARHHGVDLFASDGAASKEYRKALGYHAPFVVNPKAWTGQQIHPFEREGAAFYEVAQKAIPADSYLRAIRAIGRPLEEGRNMGPVTLTHAVK